MLRMLNSVIRNKELVERCLARMRHFDKILTEDEWDVIGEVAQFLEVFQRATEVLQGTKYPTVTLVLLFRAEIAQALSAAQIDGEVVTKMKQRMRTALNRRLPVHEIHVIAAMLDPSQRNLSSVQEFLTEHDTNAVSLLSEYMQKFTSDCGGGATQEATQETSNDAIPWKKAKQELLNKHGTAATSQDRELQQYRCLNVSPDDVLEWWRLQRSTFPRLSQLARAILAVPATSAPSERIFSVAGLAINAKRSCLNPNTADKIIFVHENWRFVK